METNELILHLIKERDAFYRRGMELAHNKCQSDDIGEIASAFAKAQKEYPPVTKSKQGYGYKYATLEGLLDVIRPVLNKHELSVSQFTDEYGILCTRVRHSSGQWFESRMKLKEVEAEGKRSYEQAVGSMLTYMRRYQLLAILGAQPEGQDDDAGYRGK